MARVTVVGNAVVITSTMKYDELKLIKKFRSNALTLMDGEEPIFAIGVGCGDGSINKFGATFGGETHDAEKKATITMSAEEFAGEDIKANIADKLGCALVNLSKLEETLPAVLAEIAAEKAAVMEKITLA